MGLRQYSLPKVQFASKTPPKDFSACSELGGPYLPVKSALAAACIGRRGKIILAISPSEFDAILDSYAGLLMGNVI